MNAADEDCGVEWLTSLCNLTVAQGRIPDDWKSSILLPNLQRERRPNGSARYRTIKLLHYAMKGIEYLITKDQRESKDRYYAVWIYVQSSPYNICRRKKGAKERSSTLLL